MTEPKKPQELETVHADELDDEALDNVVGGTKTADVPKPKPATADGSVRPQVRTLLTKSE